MEQDEYSRALDTLVLIGNAWTRWQIYSLVRGASHRVTFDVHASDPLGDLHDSLTGSCMPSCILRFPGDPESEERLASYARGDRWRQRGETAGGPS